MIQNTKNLELYKAFVKNRHSIWEARQRGAMPGLWTLDPILQRKKFTNVFRILDHGSQFLTEELLWDHAAYPEEEILMRAFLYRYINRPEPFEFFLEEHGRYPLIEDLRGELQASWGRYGGPFFGSAYTMFCGAENAGMTRIGWAMGLVASCFLPESSGNITQGFFAAKTQQERFLALQEAPRCANFMAMQILTDWGYSMYGEDTENEFVSPGPGSKVGLRRLEPTGKLENALRWAHEVILSDPDAPRIPIPVLGSAGRPPSIMDIQNTFCEFGKYMRYLDKGPESGRQYKPAHPEKQPQPFLPMHWLHADY